MSDLVLLSMRDGGRSAVVSMNRPEQRNATSIAMLDALDAAMDRIVAAGTVQAVVLNGEGRSFCSGLDLGEVRSDPDTIRRLLVRLGQVMRRLRRLEPVTVAAVQGAAIGGGFGFMCACDLAVTHPEAKIGYPPVATGLSPALMAPWLIRKLGPSAARAMMLQAGTISGEEAHRRGLATHLTQAESVLEDAVELAAAALAAPAGALTALKQLLNDLDGSGGGDEELDRAALVSAEVMASAATQDALTRLLDGR
jgi:enoyl-CoA hydratase/carnithine racemase